MGDTATHIAATLVDRYAIKGEIARGGMASVYRAYDLRYNRDVAVKVLRHEVASVVNGERFAREIAITARLRHPNILPLLDSGESDGVPFYVMPYIDGDTLADRLHHEQQLPIDESVRLIGEIASALAYAHAEGVIHRDIKPSNVLLAQGHALVADFGIARALGPAATERITDSGLALGTAHYMSPEQASGGPIDARSDIYALGCLLYEMLAGTPPFTGTTPQSIMARHAVDPMPSLRTVRGTVSPALEGAIRKALSKAPADRYVTALDFKTAIEVAAVDTRRRVRRRVGRWVGACTAAVAIVALVVWRVVGASGGMLDPNRVMIFPIDAGVGGSATIGEDAATLIGSAFDGAGPLRSIDAWPLLPAALRANTRDLNEPAMTRLAAARNCGRYVTGRILQSGDSTIVILNLWNADSATTIARGRASALNADAWRLALRAATELLPRLVPGASRELVAGWEDRNPLAIANFLLGESALRRGHFEEAQQRYRDAVRADSLFSLAAIRGAQAATWNHRAGDAAALVQVAMRQPLPPRLAHLARGYDAYLAGRADSAANELRTAIALDPEMAVAWAQLGEVYSHLLPRSANNSPDSLAADAFDHALRFDSTAANVLYHPIQIALRRGDLRRAAALRSRFLGVHPDSGLVYNVEIMTQCVEHGATGVRWEELARTHPLPLLGAAVHLAAGGAQPACAIAALRAILAVDTATADGGAADGRNWGSLLGLHGLLISEGRSREAVAAIDSFISHRHYGNSLFLLAGPYDSVVAGRAREVARADAQQYGPHYEKAPRPLRLWELGRWELHEGRLANAQAIANDLRARSEKSEKADDMLLARSLEARLTLARGDTARALSMLAGIVPAAAASVTVQWSEVASVADERLLLAQLLLAKGDAAGALATANVFESPSPAIYSLFLRASLDVRAAAARSLGDTQLQSRFQSRIAALR